MKNLLFLSFFLISSLVWAQQPYSFEAAQKQAAAESKKILLVFSGSDWCGPCIKMDKNLKSGALLALAATAGLSSCSRYEEGGPSLRSASSRLEGEWELVECENEDIDDVLDAGIEYVFEFEKDGDVKMSVSGEYEYNFYGYSYTYDIDYSDGRRTGRETPWPSG